MNGHVVRSVPRLGARTFVLSNHEGCLSNLFTELDQNLTKENLRTIFPVDRKPYTGDYDYDDDSDLEEDEDWDLPGVESKENNDKSDSGILVGSQNSDAKGGEPLDTISASDVKSLSSDSADTKAESEVAIAPAPTHVGTVVIIDDVAFVT